MKSWSRFIAVVEVYWIIIHLLTYLLAIWILSGTDDLFSTIVAVTLLIINILFPRYQEILDLVTISEKGVRVKRYLRKNIFLTWDSIETIGFTIR